MNKGQLTPVIYIVTQINHAKDGETPSEGQYSTTTGLGEGRLDLESTNQTVFIADSFALLGPRGKVR